MIRFVEKNGGTGSATYEMKWQWTARGQKSWYWAFYGRFASAILAIFLVIVPACMRETRTAGTYSVLGGQLLGRLSNYYLVPRTGPNVLPLYTLA